MTYYAASYPRTYEDAKREWARSRSDAPMCDRNTRIHRRGPTECGRAPMGPASFAVQFHRTDVVTFHPDGSATLDSGGHETVTTKDRLRQCGIDVFSTLGIWSVRVRGEEYLFEDGMRIYPSGLVKDRAGRPMETEVRKEAIAEEGERRREYRNARAREDRKRRKLEALSAAMIARAEWKLRSVADRLAGRLNGGASPPAGCGFNDPVPEVPEDAVCGRCGRRWSDERSCRSRWGAPVIPVYRAVPARYRANEAPSPPYEVPVGGIL